MTSNMYCVRPLCCRSFPCAAMLWSVHHSDTATASEATYPNTMRFVTLDRNSQNRTSR